MATVSTFNQTLSRERASLNFLSSCIRLIVGYFILFFNVTVPLTQAIPRQQVHQYFTVDELKNVFQVSQHHEVPDYDVVHIRSLQKRDSPNVEDGINTKEIHISAFGRDYRLRLQRNDHLSKSADRLKMFMAEMHTDGNLNLTEVTFPGNNSDIGEVYQDDASGAAVILHHAQDGTLLLDGTIGSGLAIKPAPPRVHQDYHHIMSPFPDDEFFLDNELPDTPETDNSHMSLNDAKATHSSTSTTPPPTTTTVPKSSNRMHIVYQRNQPENSTLSDYMFMEPDRLPLSKESQQRFRRSTRHRREAPEAVWPEILVIVDYDTYNMHGGNNVDIKRYFISFWNGVDLRYKLLGGPKVRISLAGIIISKGRDATPYLENNRVGGNAVDSAGALTELGKYLFRERRLPTYDIAVVVTKLDICRRRKNGLCRRGTAGFAYVGGACVVNKRLEKVNSVAIIEDTGGFSGIIVAAHEVGHLLGAVHDGSPPPNYLGGPGAEHCRWEDGYIMSDLRHTERGFKWSICSTQQFKHFLNGDTAKCLYNIPHEDDELPRLLPGKLLSLDAQCRKDRGTSACFKDDRVCAQLFCFDSRSGYCVSYRPAAEGSPCGDGQFCINGRCVAEDENVIPDYSRVSEIIVPKPSDLQISGSHDPATVRYTSDTAVDQSAIPPRRTAVLDSDDEVSVQNKNDQSDQWQSTIPATPSKRTSVLDSDDVGEEGPSVSERQQSYQPQEEEPSDPPASALPQKRTSVLDNDHVEPTPIQTHSHTLDNDKHVSGIDESDDGVVPGHYRVRSDEPSGKDIADLRRMSHATEVNDNLSFFEDAKEFTTPRNLPNSVTKTGESDVFDKSKDHDVLLESGCRDIMHELAGGLTCKQFLRRFGDRYCNHHYIIGNCCASRKLICKV